MPKTSIELREERATIVETARKDWAVAEKRDSGPTTEDVAAFDRAMDGADKLQAAFARLERLETAERSIDAPQERRSEPIRTRETTEAPARSESRSASPKRKAWRKWLAYGEVPSELRYEASVGREAFNHGAYASESRDVTIAGTGQYLITPVEISDDIVQQMNNMVFVRALCAASNSITTVTAAQKLGIRTKSARMSSPAWTSEVGSLSVDSSLAFNRRDLEPQQLAKGALISIRTLQLTTDAEKEVNEELAYQFSIAQENAYLNGDGSGKPLGVFVLGTSSGITTARDVTAQHAVTVTGDDLIEVKFSLKQQYWTGPSVSWVMHRQVVKAVRKIKGSSTAGYGDQQYVWQPGLTEGAPDRLLDLPISMSEYAPGTIAASNYSLMLGNFRYYRIAELAAIPVQRLVELYAATGEVGFIGRYWGDGQPVLDEAFARLLHPASG